MRIGRNDQTTQFQNVDICLCFFINVDTGLRFFISFDKKTTPVTTDQPENSEFNY